MDIKSKAHILKKRSKELGYDIKLTHAQEIISSLYGHQSRHSALLEDKKQDQSSSLVSESKDQNKQESGLEFYFGSKTLPEDDYKLSELAFNVGLKIGAKHGKEILDTLNKIIDESDSQHKNQRIQSIFSRSLSHGVLRALTSKLNIDPLKDYFDELEKRQEVSRMGGLDVLQKVLKNKTKEKWLKLEKLFKG